MPTRRRLKGALLDLLAHDGETDAEALRDRAGRAAGTPSCSRACEKGITTQNVWGTGPDAAPDDVLSTWKQLVALHRQWHSLIKELKEAEQALGQDTDRGQLFLVAGCQGSPCRRSTGPRP